MSEQGKLNNKVERSNLESEYKELCQDWRWRDKYVLDKLAAAGILFGLLGVAIGIIPPTAWAVKLFLLSIGALFSIILSISVAKDTYYRDGTEKLVRRLSARLGINSSLQTLKSLDLKSYFNDGLNFRELQFLRKISIQRNRSSLIIPSPLRNWLLNRATFRWILAFYLVSFSIFLTLFTLILVNHTCGLNLPI